MGRRNKKARLKRAALISAAQAKRSKVSGSKGVSGKAKGRREAAGHKYSVDDLMEKVDECVDTFQVELACKFAERALEIEPNSTLVLDTLAPLLLEVGDVDRAVEYFKHCIDLSPDIGHAKYLYMAQLMSGEEAVKFLTKGIAIMEGGRESEAALGAGDGGEEVASEEISTAYCTLAEIYLTDSCFSEGAGENCHGCCRKAIQLSPSNPEAHQLLASCLLSQGKEEDAKKSLMKGVSLWLPSKVGGASSSEGASVEGAPISSSFPPYFSRINTAKLLLEVQEYETAFEVLEGLLHEDDEVVGVWYLMGWLHHLTGDADSARFYLEQTQTLFAKLDCDEVELLQHTQELLSELGPQQPPGTEGVEPEGGGAEDLDDSDSELLEEDNDTEQNMDLS